MDAKQILPYAKKAGFSGNDLGIAIAIALAESSGNPKAHNNNRETRDNSYGLWQINMYGSLGPARRKQYKLSKNEDLFDPTTNARVAYGIYKSRGGFADWSTYTSGVYKKSLNAALIAVSGKSDWDNPNADFGGEDFKDDPSFWESVNVANSIKEFANTMGNTLFKLGLNSGAVLIAVVLFILGVIILLRSPLQKAALTAASVGKRV